ncbi:hypothetical protein AYJ00_14290 [Shewanella algae]|nr:hypothetical protein AYJ00_14290 [Shewanella algae]
MRLRLHYKAARAAGVISPEWTVQIVKFKFDIKENAIDSFNEALSKYEEGEAGALKAFKFSITHLSHCIELVLKMYLQSLDKYRTAKSF